MIRCRFAAAAALALGLCLPASAPGHEPAGPGRSGRVAAAPLPVIRDAPDFTLVDHEGRHVRLSELRGRVVVISFVYLSCPTACPLITQRMAVLYQRLTRASLTPGRVTLLSITVDPQRDNLATLHRYARAVGANGAGWRFVRDAPERLRPVLTAFDEWTRPLSGGEVDHPARLYLVDRLGRVREIYSLAFFDPRQALTDIEALLRE